MQNDFSFQSDFVEKSKGFLDKNQILALVSEEEIFSLVFGFMPKEYDYVVSPFRVDTRPGCYFERSLGNGMLKFRDYGDPYFNNEDCFSCVQRFYGLPNFYSTLSFIRDKLITGKNRIPIQKNFNLIKKVQAEITIETRSFIGSDKIFWSKYGISSSHLIQDRVFPIRRYKIKGQKGENLIVVSTNCYAFTDFEQGRKKLYFPYKKGTGRFISTCLVDDLGGINTILPVSQLVITKSYKDWRVLRNVGVNCIWLQSETSIPRGEILMHLLEEYDELVILFDNDKVGLRAAEKFKELLDTLAYGKTKTLSVPVSPLVKDPADMRFVMGELMLVNFLNEHNIKFYKE